jgi:hypothetical protein
LQYAVSKYPTLGGVMGWQWGSDTTGGWVKTLKGGFAQSALHNRSTYEALFTTK